MQLAALCNLNLGAKQFFNCLSERLADLSAVGQDAPNGLQVGRTAAEGKQYPLAVSHIRRRNGDGVGQALGVNSKMALDPRSLFSGIVAFLSGASGVLDAPRVDDQKAR